VTDRKPRVLFVDDEPAILASLRTLLHRDRKRWDMVFAPGGDAALAEAAKAPFDVVVSDMRMPGMDGATLLSRIQAEYPATVRIMLTGHADREAIVRALPALHQLLTKPCEGEVLRAAIERGMEGYRRDAIVRTVIARLDKLPSPPSVYAELTQLLKSSMATLADVARIVERDPSIAAKVLQLVNTAYFGTGHATSSIEQAVGQLGTEKLRYIALTASVFYAVDEVPGLSLDELRRSSYEVARVAKTMVTPSRGDDAFAAGLLHQVGKLIFALGMPGPYGEVLARVRAGEALAAVEREVIGADHAEVGAELLRIWGLPASIFEAIRFYREPASAPEAVREVAAAIHIATTGAHGMTPACPSNVSMLS
jgi:HD-like signal output (HDOD) protein